jgi:hypothetical protein
MIAKDDNTRFCTERIHHFVLLDGEDAHCWNGTRGSFFTKSTVLRKRYFFVGVEGFDAIFLFSKTLKLHVSIWMFNIKSGQKGMGAFA